jgi:hypothetical protein
MTIGILSIAVLAPKSLSRAQKAYKFWSAVQTQFESSDFSVVLRVRDALGYDRDLGRFLIPFLDERVSITPDLDVKTRFDLLSDTAKFNFVSLFCFAQNRLPEMPANFLTDGVLSSIYRAYTEQPDPVINRVSDSQLMCEEEPPDLSIQSSPSTPEFFGELDGLVARYPQHTRDILEQHLAVPSFQAFHGAITAFFGDNRSLEGCQGIARFVVRPFIASLTSSANRLVSDALFVMAPLIPDIFMDEVVRPIVFDENSKVYQFELLQRLFKNANFSEYALSHLFSNRSPSLEGPIKSEALNFLRSAIQASPPLTASNLAHVMLHLRTQIAHNPDQASPLFIIFLSKHTESLTPDLRDLALSIIATLSPRLQKVASKLLNPKS